MFCLNIACIVTIKSNQIFTDILLKLSFLNISKFAHRFCNTVSLQLTYNVIAQQIFLILLYFLLQLHNIKLYLPRYMVFIGHYFSSRHQKQLGPRNIKSHARHIFLQLCVHDFLRLINGCRICHSYQAELRQRHDFEVQWLGDRVEIKDVQRLCWLASDRGRRLLATRSTYLHNECILL